MAFGFGFGRRRGGRGGRGGPPPSPGGDGCARALDAPSAESHAMDEVYEQLWMHEEERAGAPMPEADLLAGLREIPRAEALLETMAARALLAREGGAWRIAEGGRTRARQVIRRHRLAERLFVDVLEIAPELVESNACSFEHAISREVAEHICTLLGHPSTCPHGHPIPPGACCERFRTQAGPALMPLSRLPVGERGEVAYIATQVHARLDRLAALGLVPGSTLRLHQRSPSYVLFAGETQVALDEETAREIYVRPLDRRP